MKNELSKKQIEALKYLIRKSPDANEKTKKILFALIDECQGFSRSVFYLSSDKKVKDGMHSMCSSGCYTHLDAIMAVMETEFRFENFVAQEHQKPPELKDNEKVHIVWLTPRYYGSKATEVTKYKVDHTELKDELYKV